MGNAASTAETKKKANPGARAAKPRASRRSDIHPLDRAITELRNELARSPDDATLHARLGALYYRRGDLEQAQVHYRRAIEMNPKRASFHNNLGNVLADLGRLKDGIASYERAMELEQQAGGEQSPSAESTTNLELARMEYRLIHERIEYLEAAVDLDVDSAEALNALGGGYLLRNLRDQALDAFRRAAAADPANVNAARNIGFAHALDLNGPNDLSGSLAELAEFSVRFPNEARLFLHQGELLETAGLLEEAEEAYARAATADPRCLETYDLLGRLRAVLGFGGTADGTARRMHAALERISADAQARIAADKHGDDAAARFDQAFALVAALRFEQRMPESYDEIDTLLREAVRLDISDAGETAVPAGVLRAHLLEADGRKDQASLVLEQICDRYPQSEQAWFERGGLAFRRGEIALAVDAFERGTLAEPQEATSYHSLRFAFEGYRRYRTERVRFEAAVQTNPHDALAHHHMALTALSVLKDDEALFHFTRALELDPRLAEAACGRARALRRQGHYTEADEAYADALRIDPLCEEAQRALRT